ncbi:MAG: hypothetical protein AAFP68_21310, partial [Pseudomonadota bacterium]
QEERALLRKHGVRFGQHFIFMPALLKPAPTRLRLLLWSIKQDFDEFGEAPPPGHVTILAEEGRPQGYYEMAGYRKTGTRAVRIDMLERLADMIRPMDVRGGFEATQDMLSITGCTLEQFADLMSGLGYVGERGERPKSERPKQEPEQPAERKAEDTTAAVADDKPPEGTDASSTPDDAELAASEATDGADDTASAEDATAHANQPAKADQESAETAVTTSDEDVAEDRTVEPSAIAEGEQTVSGETVSEPAPEQTNVEETIEASAPQDPEPVESQADATGSSEPTTDDASAEETAKDTPAADEAEVFYIFKLKPRGRPQHRGGRPSNRNRDGQQSGNDGERQRADRSQGERGGENKGKPRHAKGDGKRSDGENFGKGKGKGGKKPRREDKKSGPRVISAGPKKSDKPIDPDNPFAVLQQLKNR